MELAEHKKKLLEIVTLVTQTQLPKNLVDLGGLLWKAFHIGEEYEKALMQNFLQLQQQEGSKNGKD
ncbi:MAG: hypothetical protein Q8K02_18205 [Flavobacterium sp.]|nr:hypothetical protein [Flavobacterium sp.]